MDGKFVNLDVNVPGGCQRDLAKTKSRDKTFEWSTGRKPFLSNIFRHADFKWKPAGFKRQDQITVRKNPGTFELLYFCPDIHRIPILIHSSAMFPKDELIRSGWRIVKSI